MAASSVRELVSRLVSLYRDEILPARTRRVHLLGRKCTPQLMKTLLGYELRLGRKRVTCPDMPTARYLQVFGEIGLASVLIPYEPNRTSGFVPELEGLLEELKKATPEPPKRRRVYQDLRRRLGEVEGEAAASVHGQSRIDPFTHG
jgi:hypothetical protein